MLKIYRSIVNFEELTEIGYMEDNKEERNEIKAIKDYKKSSY